MEAKTSVCDFSLPSDGKFRVNFDCYKARPHFIIALDDSPKTVYEDLSDDQKKKVINLALQMATEHGLRESRAVLSQHCGYWYNSTYNYHAHLCVNHEKYLGILDREKNKLKTGSILMKPLRNIQLVKRRMRLTQSKKSSLIK